MGLGIINGVANKNTNLAIASKTTNYTASLNSQIDLGEIKEIVRIYFGCSQDQGQNFTLTLTAGETSYEQQQIKQLIKGATFHHEVVETTKLKVRYIQLNRYGLTHEHESCWIVVQYKE